MDRNIQLIWDFYGEDALKTAKHHAIHLQEFFENQNYAHQVCGAELIKDNHAIGFIFCTENIVHIVKNILKPQRANIAV